MNNSIENKAPEKLDDLIEAFNDLTDIELEERISKEQGGTGVIYC